MTFTFAAAPAETTIRPKNSNSANGSKSIGIDPGGWCAIRPVEGSFTWISRRYLKPTENHLAVVRKTMCRPRGQQLQRHPRRGASPAAKGRVGGDSRTAAPRRQGRGRKCLGKNRSALRRIPLGAGEYLDADYLPSDGIRKTTAAGKEKNPESARFRSTVAGEESSHTRILPSRSRLRPRVPERSWIALELELSSMVIEEPTAWSFDSLRGRTNELMDQAQTAVERGRARLLANKIARFDDIKQRQDAVLAMREQTDRSSRLWAGLRPRTPAARGPSPISTAVLTASGS